MAVAVPEPGLSELIKAAMQPERLDAELVRVRQSKAAYWNDVRAGRTKDIAHGHWVIYIDGKRASVKSTEDEIDEELDRLEEPCYLIQHDDNLTDMPDSIDVERERSRGQVVHLL